MKKLGFIAVPVMYLFLTLIPVSAEAQPTRFYDYASPSPCGTIEANRPCYGSGPTVSICYAYATNGQYCHGCVINASFKEVCGYKREKGGCSCENKQRDGSGPGITDCVVANSTCYYYS